MAISALLAPNAFVWDYAYSVKAIKCVLIICASDPCLCSPERKALGQNG